MLDITAFIEENLKRTIHRNTEDNGTLLGLPFPYTVPCADDSFLEMYYWDTYFTNLGLISIGNIELAKNNIDNMLWLVEKYGFMPNGNRTYYLNRSQPPFLCFGVKDIFSVTHDKDWLLYAYEVLWKEYNFWQTRRLAPNGLNFYGNYLGLDDEKIEALYKDYIKRCGTKEIENVSKTQVAHTILTFVESGWDCCSRFEADGENFNPIDLNALLYGFEVQMSEFSSILENGNKDKWIALAEKRKMLMDELLWNDEYKIYCDYNFRTNKLSKVISAASLYPAYVGFTEKQGETGKLVNSLILKYGISCSINSKYVNGYQWDYPNVWAPIQYIAYKACDNCGLNVLASEIREKYINLIDTSYKNTGNLWEKYNGTTGETACQEYDAPTMMGWTAGVYLYFKHLDDKV